MNTSVSEFIQAVAKVDKPASEYIQKALEESGVTKFPVAGMPCNHLLASFDWQRTPQGTGYWIDLYYVLLEVYGETPSEA